ncbi:MAG: SH3 domain-containing protein [Lachnospiraceae bacterium]|nr:SH3 domain-containing protein [Lachnospiraceae bacterium]
MKLRDDGFEDFDYEVRNEPRRRSNRRTGDRQHSNNSRGRGGRNDRVRNSRRRRRGGGFRILLFLFLFAAIAGTIFFLFRSGIFDGFFETKTEADLNAVFHIQSEEEGGLVLNGSYADETAYFQGDEPYLSLEFVRNNLNNWFYFDDNEKLLLYTLPDRTEQWTYGGSDVIERNGAPWISLSLIQQYTELETEVFRSQPKRIFIHSEFGKKTTADTAKNTYVHVDTSSKSDVVTSLDSGTTVRIVSANSAWARVETPDGYLGFIDNGRLENFQETEQAAPGNVPALVFNRVQPDRKIILGWHQVMSSTANGGVSSLFSQDASMNVIAPTWFSLSDTEGGMTNYSSADYVAAAHAAGVQVWPVIDNFNVSGFQPTEGAYAVLSRTSVRQRLIESLINNVKAVGADGINVDFENLSGETGVHFAQFIKELSIACHLNGLVLSADNYVPKAYSKHYSRDVQGKVCDYVIIMGYDEYNASSTEAGPVASIDFVREGIEATLQDVEPNRVINGIPFFSRIWSEKNGVVQSTKAVGMGEAKEFLSGRGVTASWDDASGCNYGQVEENGFLYRIWLEDKVSIQAKLSLMDTWGLQGAAFWKLGLEEASIWEDIAAYAAR